tara:strand:+ start:436 stop:1479 length:1044 start_codon:yes stop_codon:yes gene_type:complete
MKIKTNKWTLALAAAGIVSLPSLANAQEAAAGADALAASTTLSGYVSTSYTFQDGTGADIGKTNEDPDQFKLDVVSLTLSSPQGAGEYATGYTVGMWIGPDDQHTDENFSLTQANIDLRLPVGTGIDLKVGYFGTVVGYEVYEYTDNAFFQRGLGFFMEPTHHTGILASYQLTDDLGITAGIVNDGGAVANNNQGDNNAATAITASYTTPDSMGFAGGTSVYVATVQDLNAFGTGSADFWYASVGLPTGVEGLSVDLAADWVDWEAGGDDEIYQLYASYALSEKATLNARYEWGTSDENSWTGLESVAVGVTYDLWDNVLSRVEYMSTSEDGSEDDDTLAFNLIYSF